MFGKRTNPPVQIPEARAVPPTAATGLGSPASYDGTKRAILVALVEAIVAAGTGPLDVETAREREIEHLYAKIGQLTVERDFLSSYSSPTSPGKSTDRP